MKTYKEVVEERYDKQRYDAKGIKNNMYASLNPVGFYGEFKAAQILQDFVSVINARGVSLDKMKICDCGCGDGVKTRFIAELLGGSDHVYGIEYSENRLQHCKDMNPVIHYANADLTVRGGIPFDVPFHGITAFTVFMHFNSEREILNALKNIYGSLDENGVFLWYDVNAKSHWDGRKKKVDGWGYSPGEMDKFAAKAGFELIKGYGAFANIPILNTSTIYLAEKIKSIWALELLEKLPFRKNNNIRIYAKRKVK